MILLIFRGDIESLSCSHKFRMDLRLLCHSVNKSYDLTNGEFAREEVLS
jgi:hypothetical protein